MLQIHVTFGVSRLKKIKHDLYHCKRRCMFQRDKTKLPICNIYRVIKENIFTNQAVIHRISVGRTQSYERISL